MINIKPEDIVFWLAIMAAIGIVLWKLFGSPTDMATLISVFSLLVMSELAIWRKIYSVESKTTISFEKVKSRFDNLETNINNRFDNIENLLKRKK